MVARSQRLLSVFGILGCDSVLVSYEGIVVARREVGDNSCYIDILTDEQGIIEAAAHGAKKMNSSLLSSAALFSYSTFCLSKNKLRYTVNSAKPKYSFHALGSDIDKLALASYFAQAVKFCTPSEQVQSANDADSTVRFFAVSLYETLHGRALVDVKSTFELRYSSMLGFAPSLVACDHCCRYDNPGGMYFLPDKGLLLCADCFNPDYGGEHEMLLPETLHAMRNIIFSPLDTAFKFEISPNASQQLSKIAEHYFLYRTERSFTALEYYKKLL